jgi:hypothetical protein
MVHLRMSNSSAPGQPERLFYSDYEISMLIIERDACYTKAQAIDELLNRIGQAKGFADASKPTSKPDNSGLPGTDLSNLPWKSYKTKQNATPDEAAWIFSNTQGAEALLATLKSNDGKKTIGNFEYTFSGNEKQFIARKPKA